MQPPKLGSQNNAGETSQLAPVVDAKMSRLERHIRLCLIGAGIASVKSSSVYVLER